VGAGHIEAPVRGVAIVASAASPKLGSASDARQANLYARLRQPPSPATAPGTLPVLFFGDLLEADVASVGLNPSDQEYLSKDGVMLAAHVRRERVSLTPASSLHLRDIVVRRSCDSARTAEVL
jgi:hypothetical protein